MYSIDLCILRKFNRYMFLILSIICVKRHGNHSTQPEVDEMDESHQRKGFKENISKI